MNPDARQQAEDLLKRRQAARAARDFAAADDLRLRIEELGFTVLDSADGPQLRDKPRYKLLDVASGLPAYADGAEVAVTLIVDGWLDDALACIRALLLHEPASVHILVVDVSEDSDTALALEQAAGESDAGKRLHVVHLPGGVGWSAIHAAAALACKARFYAIADMSSVVSGPAIKLCADELQSTEGCIAAGWRGANFDAQDAWRSVIAADAGDCDVLMSYLMVMPTNVAASVPPHPKAKFYRNADIEWCLMLREQYLAAHGGAGRMRCLGDPLPVTQSRHHGYHDSDEQMRERESRKTYDRILAAFRGRSELLQR